MNHNEMNEVSQRESAVYQEYIRGIHKSGTATLIALLVFTFVPGLYMCIVENAFPGITPILGSIIALVGVEGWSWFVEPTLYFPMLGVTGTYMSYVAGNISNMRIPAATAAQKAVDAKVGTLKSEIAGVIGIIASIVVNFVVLFAVIFFGDALMHILPCIVQQSFDYALPAVYGTVVALLISRIKK